MHLGVDSPEARADWPPPVRAGAFDTIKALKRQSGAADKEILSSIKEAVRSRHSTTPGQEIHQCSTEAWTACNRFLVHVLG